MIDVSILARVRRKSPTPTAYPIKASRTLADLRVSVDPKGIAVLAAEAGDGVVVCS
jgi:hypothetical protein